MLERFWLAFIPLFVAFDALALLPLYWSLAEGLSNDQRRSAIHQASLVAWLVGLSFLVISGWVWRFLGINVADVMIAGGLILFVLSINDLLHTDKARHGAPEEFGIVPLGVPLIVGPAVLTTLLLTRERHGVWVTAMAFNANILLTWAMLLAAERLLGWMGREGTKVMSKVANLILASFAVMLVRQGVTMLLARPY